jgi:hypothetical protein
MELQVVHLRVNDAATGKPTPVRLRLTDAQGRYYAPLGRLPDLEAIREANPYHGGSVVLAGKAYAYISGACEALLPAGTIHVEISKGPRYQAITQAVDRPAGKLALRFEMKPIADSPLADFALADLFVRLVAEQTDEGELRLIDDYSGEGIAAECAGCKVQVGTYNQGGELGSLVLFNTHRIVYPLRLDQPGFSHYRLEDWIHQAQRKNGRAFFVGERNKRLDGDLPRGVDAVLIGADAAMEPGFCTVAVAGSGRADSTSAIGDAYCLWPKSSGLLEAIKSGTVQLASCRPSAR